MYRNKYPDSKLYVPNPIRQCRNTYRRFKNLITAVDPDNWEITKVYSHNNFLLRFIVSEDTLITIETNAPKYPA